MASSRLAPEDPYPMQGGVTSCPGRRAGPCSAAAECGLPANTRKNNVQTPAPAHCACPTQKTRRVSLQKGKCRWRQRPLGAGACSRVGQSGQGDGPPCSRFAPRFLLPLMRLLQDSGCGGICRVPQLCRAKGPARGEGGAGAACEETAVLGMQSGSSVASES